MWSQSVRLDLGFDERLIQPLILSFTNLCKAFDSILVLLSGAYCWKAIFRPLLCLQVLFGPLTTSLAELLVRFNKEIVSCEYIAACQAFFI